jgi:hypothetical protein
MKPNQNLNLNEAIQLLRKKGIPPTSYKRHGPLIVYYLHSLVDDVKE